MFIFILIEHYLSIIEESEGRWGRYCEFL